jgi:cysteine-rich repeat protein
MRRDRTPLVGVALVLLARGVAAAPPTERFHGTLRGGLSIAGNTLGLSKAILENGPGTADGIGTFMTTNPGLVDDSPLNPSNPWFPGTTNSYTLNSSASDLRLPASATVLYAELVWAGSTHYGSSDVRTLLDSPVVLSYATGGTAAVPPDPATAVTIEQDGESSHRYYVRSANVSPFVQEHGAGTYVVSGVPATEDTQVNFSQAAGWALLVAYSDPLAPSRTLTLVVDGRLVTSEQAAEVTFAVDTPVSGPIDGRLLLAALEGDASRPGDRVLVSALGGAGFVTLSGANNPAANFFASQINDNFGALDTTGTFGDRNHDALSGTNVVGGRQGWDLTGVPLAPSRNEIGNGQSGAVIRVESSEDEVILTALALESTAPETPAVCGNGTLEEGEECDDGNLIDGDGCDSTCRLTPARGFCGNGLLDPGEECDAGSQNGFPACACESDCRRPSIGTACGLIADYRARLASCEADARLRDGDGDGEPDVKDRCPGTLPGAPVDDAGCSLAQFCASFDVSTVQGALRCRFADWGNDEPLMGLLGGDCRVERPRLTFPVCSPAS